MTTPPAPKKPKAAKKPVNNLPLRPRVGLHLRQRMRDLCVVLIGVRGFRVWCVTPGDGGKLKRIAIQWKRLRADKTTRAL